MFDDILNIFEGKEAFYEHDEWISEHIEHHFPDAEVTVFHEFMTILPPKIHVYYVQLPQYNFLLTSGMSTYEMTLEEEVKDKKKLLFAEVFMLLPKTIDFGKTGSLVSDQKYGWIVDMMKYVARFPHLESTWLGIGHSIQANIEGEPFDEKTKFTGAILLPQVTFKEDFHTIKREGRTINIYNLFPLYKEEQAYKVEHGYNAFLQLLIDSNLKEMFSETRKNLVKKSFWNKLGL